MSVKVNGHLIGKKCFPVNERIFDDIKDIKTSAMRGLCSRDFINRDVSNTFNIELKYETDIDFMILNIVKRYLDDKYSCTNKRLYIYYMPYARMDRETEDEICTIKYVCNIINDLKFSEVNIVDPHSNITPALLNNCKTYYPFAMHDNIINEYKIDYILFPDLGASKKYSSLHKYTVPYMNGYKIRSKDNSILNYDIINAPTDLKSKNILIIDDICSAGRTFLNAGQMLKNKYFVSKVFLFSTFVENTIYNGELIRSTCIDKIFTTNFLGNHFYNDKEESDSTQDVYDNKIISFDFYKEG